MSLALLCVVVTQLLHSPSKARCESISIHNACTITTHKQNGRPKGMYMCVHIAYNLKH